MEETVMQSVTTGVYVLTAQHQGRINGTTVAWVTPVSFDPPLVMVSLAGVRVSHELVKNSGYFGINVLGADQVEVGRHFGFQTARDTDKFADQKYQTSENGVPIIDGAVAYIECRVVSTYPAGEHTMFVGEVVETKTLRENDAPLVFKKEDFF